MLKRIKLASLRALITAGVLYVAGDVILTVALQLHGEPISMVNNPSVTLGVGIIIGAGIGSFFTTLHFLKEQEEDDGAWRQKLKQQANIAHNA